MIFSGFELMGNGFVRVWILLGVFPFEIQEDLFFERKILLIKIEALIMNASSAIILKELQILHEEENC